MRGKAFVTDEDFIRAWQTSASRHEVAARLGMNPNACVNRARRLRLRGVALKPMRIHTTELREVAMDVESGLIRRLRITVARLASIRRALELLDRLDDAEKVP